MGYMCPLFQIKVLHSHIASGGHFRRYWVSTLTLASPFIPKLMGTQSKLFEFKKIFFILVFYILEVSGTSFQLWQSFLIIIAFTRVFKCPYLRHCCSSISLSETSEFRPLSTYFLRESVDQVQVTQDRVWASHSRKNIYVNHRLHDLRFRVGDRVFLHISSMKGIMSFERRERSTPGILDHMRSYKKLGKQHISCLYFQFVQPSIQFFHVSML